jgi:hypothetical protein
LTQGTGWTGEAYKGFRPSFLYGFLLPGVSRWYDPWLAAAAFNGSIYRTQLSKLSIVSSGIHLATQIAYRSLFLRSPTGWKLAMILGRNHSSNYVPSYQQTFCGGPPHRLAVCGAALAC